MQEALRNGFALRSGALVVALAAAFPVHAQGIDPERAEAIAALTETENLLRVGVGYLSDDGRRFGQYTGIRDQGFHPSLGGQYETRDRLSGGYATVKAVDLGLEGAEIGADLGRQGAWRVRIDAGQFTRYEPMVVNTGLTGIGSSSVAVNGTAIRPVDLEMQRRSFAAAADYHFDKTMAVRVRFTHDTKEGARLFGRGTFATPAAIEFLAEPIDRTTQTLEVAASYTTRRFQFSGGYYGTLFANHDDSLFVSGGASALNGGSAGNPTFSPMSMPLSNNSHQLFLSGGFNLSPATRAAFRATYTIARQNEALNPPSLGPSPLAGAPASLDGRVDTTLLFVDLTSMEFDRIDLQANVRFEDRDDKTPERQFMSSAAPNASGTVSVPLPGTLAGVTGFNKPRSWSSLKSKVEAGYQFPDGYKLLAAWDFDHQERNAPEPYRRVSFRTETDEHAGRIEAKRTYLDVLTGGVVYQAARRTGSAWLPATYDTDGSGTNGVIVPFSMVNPLLWADRDRHLWKTTVDWTPSEEWTVHFVHETAKDRYSGRELGPRAGKRFFNSIDAVYAFTDRWRGHLWWSRDDMHADQATMVNPTNPPAGFIAQRWQANIRQLTEGVGVGVQGRTRGGVELGIDVSYSDQSNEHRLSALTGTNPVTSLPEYAYRLTEIRAFANQPIDAASSVRAEYAFAKWHTNDWTWNGWVYSDGTTLTQPYEQRTHFLGASYLYRWR